ncbi:hypothetical protein E1161_04275 [Saccharopolyspora aridisoli]|uniref:HNH endonuclease n=1 Tax=Saccharopolyspora aridisoli TaxID=2530385 RepID=A0A4R4V7P8_9PSEU|nr:hypothetical protein [Saccharopolyspora aridisoli]TDC95409.1 hypothetical protein E1161_04275 [Saccharopolyspora aridisoli]
MRIALQPAALNDRDVAQHYRDTIDSRVPFSKHVDVVPSRVLTTLGAEFPQHTAQFWGATRGRNDVNVTKWQRLEPGDAVFFYGKKHLYLAGHIVLTFRNAALADRLWGRNQDGLTWELMFALTNLRHISVPIEEVRSALDWNDNAFVQGFTVYDGDKADRLAELVNLDALTTPAAQSDETTRSNTAPDGPTDGTRTSSWRREHTAFKQRLVELSDGSCALCGNHLPPAFLVGAHIKKRAMCSEDERKDFDNVGMLACVLGCDSLFEHGFIAVDNDGTIIISDTINATPAVEQFVKDRLDGRTTTWWTPQREPYFDWHRRHTFIKPHDGA